MAILRFLMRPLVLAVVVLLVMTLFLVYAVDNAQNSTGPVGDRGRAMLSGPYWAIHFEIDYMPGYAPEPGALDRLRGFVLEHTGKIALFTLTEIPSYAGPSPQEPSLPCVLPPCAQDGGYSMDQVISIHESERNTLPLPGYLQVWVLYADRASSEGEQVGAAAFCATCVVVFEPGARSSEIVQAIILAHELGHLLGLCAISYADVRSHCDGEGHSENPESLMYYAPDLGDPDIQALRLDADDLADLEDLRTGRL